MTKDEAVEAERERLHEALKVCNACIWCCREEGHSPGCVVAKAFDLPTKGKYQKEV
jgi:hypothetical protein